MTLNCLTRFVPRYTPLEQQHREDASSPLILSGIAPRCWLGGSRGWSSASRLPELRLACHFNLPPSFRSVCDGSWNVSSLKLRTKKPLKNQQRFFAFVVFVGIKKYFISYFHCLYTNGWKQYLVCDFTGGKFICVCMYQRCLSLWKCSILLLKAKQTSPTAFWNRKEEFREEESLILLFVETEQCREKEIAVVVMCQWCAEKRQGAICLHQGQVAGLTSSRSDKLAYARLQNAACDASPAVMNQLHLLNFMPLQMVFYKTL